MFTFLHHIIRIRKDGNRQKSPEDIAFHPPRNLRHRIHRQTQPLILPIQPFPLLLQPLQDLLPLIRRQRHKPFTALTVAIVGETHAVVMKPRVFKVGLDVLHFFDVRGVRFGVARGEVGGHEAVVFFGAVGGGWAGWLLCACS